MSLSQVFIRRPIATALLMVGILVFGLASFTLLPIAALPNVDFPTIVVPANVARRKPADHGALRRNAAGATVLAANSGPGADVVHQRARLDLITLQFDLARNIDGAAEDVQTAINAASGLLPKNLPPPPTFKKTNPANQRNPDLCRQFRRDADSGHRPVRLQCAGRVALTREWRRRRSISPASRFLPRTCRSTRTRWPHVASAWRMCALRWSMRQPICRRAIWKASASSSLWTPTTSCSTRRRFGNIIAAYRNGAPVQIKDIGEVVNSSQSARTGAWFDGKRI